MSSPAQALVDLAQPSFFLPASRSPTLPARAVGARPVSLLPLGPSHFRARIRARPLRTVPPSVSDPTVPPHGLEALLRVAGLTLQVGPIQMIKRGQLRGWKST